MATSGERITGRWHGHKFTVSSKKIMSFVDLQLKGSSETEDLIKGSEKFVKYKNAKPKEVSFTIKLNAMMGCDVKKEAQAIIKEAEKGVMDYLYIGRKKAMSCKLMLTDASVKEIAFSAGMKWLWADVAVTLKQSSTNDGSTDGKSTSSSGGGGGGGKRRGGGTRQRMYEADDERKKQMREARERAEREAEEDKSRRAEERQTEQTGQSERTYPHRNNSVIPMER